MMNAPTVGEVQAAVGTRYGVAELYASGGMGAVFVAHHHSLGSKVAIKVLPQPGGASAEGFARFKREAELAAKLSHPNIVPVFEFEFSLDLAFFVMPFIVGESLAQVLKRDQRLPYPAVRELLRQVGSALAFAHERGVVHRDIKPGNILLERDTGRWLIADFGVARVTEAPADERTVTGAVLGTPAYMAPEQALGLGDVDGRADLYSLAATAYEALTGTRTDTLHDVASLERALRDARPDLSGAVVHALARPLAHDRSRRPASVTDWLASLPEARGGFPMVRAAGLAAAAGAGALALWFALRDRPAPVPATTTIAVMPLALEEGAVNGVDLGRALSTAMEDQLRYLPDYEVVSADRTRRALGGDLTALPRDPDSLYRFAEERLGAGEVLWGSVSVRHHDSVRLQIQVRAGARGEIRRAEATHSLDSLSALVSDVVVEAFAKRITRERLGWSSALPRGFEAISAYDDADQRFRRADYAGAIEQLNEVIRQDSTFAPAYFKRMLAEVLRARPTRASTDVRSALDAARRYTGGLDPASRQLLQGYEVLLTQGDLVGAQDTFQAAVERHPDVVDAWFVLGYLQFNFAPLMGIERSHSRAALLNAYKLDSEFAAVVAQLARLAVLEEDDESARRFIREYLAIDHTSIWAEVARMGDSLLYRGLGAATGVVRSYQDRPAAALELIGLASGELYQKASSRKLSHDAVTALWDMAASRQDQLVAFRMRMATALGFGREATADTLWREARRRNWQLQGEQDRWVVLTAVTQTASLGGSAAPAAAAERLLSEAVPGAEGEDGTTAWLAARWYHGRAAARAAQARRALRARVASDSAALLARSLLDDLDAQLALDTGDTVAAVDALNRATRRYSIADVVFGLVGSLWPLRLELARLAAAQGDQEGVLAATASFESMAGVVDQVAWPEVLVLRGHAYRALGDAVQARETYSLLHNMLNQPPGASGSRAALRDSVASWLAAVGRAR